MPSIHLVLLCTALLLCGCHTTRQGEQTDLFRKSQWDNPDEFFVDTSEWMPRPYIDPLDQQRAVAIRQAGTGITLILQFEDANLPNKILLNHESIPLENSPTAVWGCVKDGWSLTVNRSLPERSGITIVTEEGSQHIPVVHNGNAHSVVIAPSQWFERFCHRVLLRNAL